MAAFAYMERTRVGLGVLLGLLLLAKFSTAPMFVLALLWMFLLGTDKVFKTPERWNWGKTAAALLARTVRGLGRIFLSCFTAHCPRRHADCYLS